MALLAGGGYAEEVVVDEHLVLPLPASLSYDQGAAIPEVFLTAHHNLFNLGGAKSGSRCLIHGGGGGVGTAGIALLRKSSTATVFVTVGSPEQADACRKLGAYSIEYDKQSFLEVIRRETKGQGVDVILDPVGASYLADNLKCLVMDGRLVLIGLMSGGEATLDMKLVLSRRLQVIGSTLRALPLSRKAEVVARFSDQFLAALEAGEIAPSLGRVFPASEVAEAHRWMESKQNIGKIVLRWS
jgi:NADPH:quinone reductase-like Zn-dependent oxidoreductase